jgi:hypothetical protein
MLKVEQVPTSGFEKMPRHWGGVDGRSSRWEGTDSFRREGTRMNRVTSTHNSSSAHPNAGVGSILLVDSYAQGISIGGAAPGSTQGTELILHEGDRSPVKLRSRYVLHKGEPLADLERHLQRLSSKGELRTTTIVFGVGCDPFHPFDEKFATSMRFLEMFERYAPGRLVIQTRSPLIVIGMPVLKRVRENTSILIGIETPLQDVCGRYTPHLPTVEERFKTVRALRRFGLHVGIQVAPILPYGDWRKDAVMFAQKLCSEADFLVIRSTAQMSDRPRPTSSAARLLASDRQFFWLRQDSHVPLTNAVSEIAPDLLFHPSGLEMRDPQLQLFGVR